MLIERFAHVLCEDLAPVARDRRLEMDRNGSVAIYYAPFEFINRDARVVLVGITPGPSQMVNACLAARSVLLSGGKSDEAVRASKSLGAFSGEPLRGNLLRQLRHWGVHEWLGIDDVGDLFGASRHLLQTTSLLRYPTFVGEKPYAGNPDMTGHPLLQRYLLEHFVQEVQVLPQAVFVALGPVVQRVMQTLVRQHLIPQERVITGMLHPSGQCTYRINYLVGPRNDSAPHATNVVAYDRGREIFQKTHIGEASPEIKKLTNTSNPRSKKGEANTMGMMTDISIEHTYKGKKTPAPVSFTMHPYQNSQGAHAGLFEVLRDLKEQPSKVKRSAHLTTSELAEAYARGLIEQYEIRLRLRAANGAYPDSPPGKKVPRHCVTPHSDFDRMIHAVDLSCPVSPGLRRQLGRLGL